MSSEVDFDIPTQNGYAVAYTDGACSRNGMTQAKAAYGVWFYDKCPL